MLSERRTELELRRQQLQQRSAELRSALGRQAQPLAAPLWWADRIHQTWGWLGRHPEVPLIAVVVLTVLRPARTLRWATRLWWVWGVVGRARRLVDGQAR